MDVDLDLDQGTTKLARFIVQWQDLIVVYVHHRHILAVAVPLLACCGGTIQQESVPYKYRQSMIGDGDEPAARAPAARPVTRRPARRTARRPDPNKDARRCRLMRGRTFRGSSTRATLRLIKACLRRRLPASVLRGRGVELRDGDARPGDLVLFHNTRDRNNNGRGDDRFTAAGVVLRRSGARVEFLVLRAGSARLGVLNMAQPNRRRVRGFRVENSYLRTITAADPPNTRYLAGQLLAGFVTLTEK